MKFKTTLKELINIINNKFYELDKIVEERYQSGLKEYEPYRKFKELDLQEASKDFIITEEVQRSRRKGWLLKKEYYVDEVKRLDLKSFEEWLSEHCGTRVEIHCFVTDIDGYGITHVMESVRVGNYVYESSYGHQVKEPVRSDYEDWYYWELRNSKQEIEDMITKFGEDKVIELTREDLIRMNIPM